MPRQEWPYLAITIAPFTETPKRPCVVGRQPFGLVSIANSDVTNKRSEVDRRTYERATTVIVNDWESVIENNQTELLDPIKDGVIGREHTASKSLRLSAMSMR